MEPLQLPALEILLPPTASGSNSTGAFSSGPNNMLSSGPNNVLSSGPNNVLFSGPNNMDVLSSGSLPGVMMSDGAKEAAPMTNATFAISKAFQQLPSEVVYLVFGELGELVLQPYDYCLLKIFRGGFRR